MRHLFVFSLVFLLLFCAGCAADRSYGQAPDRPFTAAIEGTRGELAFSAEVSLAANGDRTIRSTAPETLAGLTATATADGVRILQNDLSANVPSAGGLFLPLDLLTAPAALVSRQERNGEVSLIYADGTEIILNADGSPRVVIRTDLMFTISDFRNIP